MKVRKFVKWTLIIIPALLLVAVVIALLLLNRIAKATIEAQATASTHLNTTLAAANISLLNGKIKLDQLKVGSPRDFQSPTMFDLSSVAVDVNYNQLLQNPIKVARVVIEGPHLILEQSHGKLNVNVAMDQMLANQSGGDSSSMKLVIDELQINNTLVTLRSGTPDQPTEINITIPSLTLHHIGTSADSQTGAAIKDILEQMLTGLTRKAMGSTLLGNAGKWISPGPGI